MGSGELTLEDFLDQMLAIRKMGPIGNILGMLPGANSGQMKEALAQVDDKQLDRLQAIIRGMTPAERADPKIINGSRRLRIANGSGVSVGDVNDMVNRFFEARKMMKQMAGQFGFGSRSATRKQAKSRKGKKPQQKARGGRPQPARAGLPDLTGLPPSLQQLPPGLDQLPAGFDLSKLKFPPKGK
jgi:signal recognition particle subunit SRP54